MDHEEFLQRWKGLSVRWLTLDEARQAGVPSSWQTFISGPPRDGLDLLWSDAEHLLPRFVSYLKHSLRDVRIAESVAGPLLVYHLENWRELEPGLY